MKSLVTYRDDRRLVKQLLAGDEGAFAQFFDDFFPRLYRFALRRVDYDQDVAEEVVQATMCKAIDKLGTYRGESSLFTWLCTFCRFELSALHRSAGRRRALAERHEDVMDLRGALESLAANPEAVVYQQQLTEIVRQALDMLPPHYERALRMKYLEDKSVADIATALRRSPKATESILTRARRAFREAFDLLASGRSDWSFHEVAG